MRGRQIRTALVTVVTAVAVFAGVVLVANGQRDVRPQPAPAPAATGTAQQIADAEARVRANPSDAAALTDLARASFARVSETGDPRWLTRADIAGRRAVAADPRAFEAMDLLAEVAASRHRFREALRWTRRSLAIEPTRVAPHGTRADALIELGRYEEGFAAVQTRLDLRPDLASYSRASYVRELVGDRAGAVRLMRMAVRAAPPGSGDRTGARAQLALILMAQGDLAGAEREVRGGLVETPGDPDLGFVLGQIHLARGEPRRALPLFRDAAGQLPEPDHLLVLSETERSLGLHRQAAANRAAMRRAFAALRANGQDTDLDQAFMEADLRTPTARDIALARRGHATRPGIEGDHVLGWVLTRAGRCVEGDRHATRSLRLGTRDPVLFFHAGMAASCAGRERVALTRLRAALALNPHSPDAPTARREIARLSAAG